MPSVALFCAGDDKYGRKVIVVSACKLPTNKTFDNQRLLL